MPKVSVLIPIYNVEKYLRQCMDSVCAQTLQDIEIICINDGSTDSSPGILAEYAKNDSRIVVINKENTGYGHSMNVGLGAAHGEYIGIVESDDFAELDMFEVLYHAAKENDAEIVKSNYWEYRDGLDTQKIEFMTEFADGKLFAPYKRWSVFKRRAAIWAAIYKRDFLESNGICFNETPGASYQDTAFNLKVLACSERMLAVRDAFIHYRQNNAGSSSANQEKVYFVCGEFETFWDFLSKKPEVLDRIKYIVPYYQYTVYRWNYRRIAQKFKWEFLQRASADFAELARRGWLKKQYWATADWERLDTLIMEPRSIYLDPFLAEQRREFHIAGFLSAIRDYPNRYIYGAGKIGQMTAEYLFAHNIDISGFVVSSSADNPSQVMGKPVLSIDAEAISDETAIFVVAVKEDDFCDVLTSLNQAGYMHFVLVNGEIKQMMTLKNA